VVSDIAQAGGAATRIWNVYPAFTTAPGEFQSTPPSSPCTTGPEKARQADGSRHGRGNHSERDQLYPLCSKLEAVTFADSQCPDDGVNCAHYDAREYAYRRADEGDAKHAGSFQIANGKTFSFRDKRSATHADTEAATANTDANAVTYWYGDRAHQYAKE
jgi:hypothetical protein